MIDFFNSLLTEQLSYAISWTVLHSLWQASLIALVMSWYLNVCKNDDAIIRYRITYASLLFVFICALGTFAYYYFMDGGIADTVVQHTFAINKSSVLIAQEEPGVIANLSGWLSNNLNVVASMWLFGALLFSMKFGGSLLFTNNLKNNQSSIVSDSVFTQLLALKKELGINRYIKIAESAKVQTPMLIGYLKPVILFPVGLINQLSIEETNAILAHELAHIKRNDFAHNLFISLLETLFYYHPAVWWISANFRLERENCCDDLAVKTIGDKAIYARTLVKIEELKSTNIPSLAIPMARNKNQLLHRIGRIINQPQTRNQIRERIIAVMLLFTFFFGFAHTPSVNNDRHIAVSPVVETKSSFVKPDCAKQQQLLTKLTAKNKDCNCDENKAQDIQINVLSSNDKNRDILYIDTIPSSKKSNMTIINSSDDQEVVLKMKDGKITELKIDGEEIDEENYDNHLGHESLDLEEIIEKAKADFKGISVDELKESIESIKEDWNNFDFDFDKNDGSDYSFDFQFDSLHLSQLKSIHDFPINFDMDSIISEVQSNFGDQRQIHIKLIDSMNQMRDSIYSGIIEMRMDADDNIFKWHNPSGENHIYQWHNFPGNDDIFELKNRISKKQNSKTNTPTDVLIEELNKDGFLPETGSHKIELTGKHLKINGDKQPSNIYKKYKKIFEKEIGHSLTKDFKIKIETDRK